MDIKQTVGANIQKYRKLNKYTQEQLAEIVGVETISLSRIETGKNYPTSENLAKISEVLHIEPYKFYLSETEKNNAEILADILAKIEPTKNDRNKLLILQKLIDAVL